MDVLDEYEPGTELTPIADSPGSLAALRERIRSGWHGIEQIHVTAFGYLLTLLFAELSITYVENQRLVMLLFAGMLVMLLAQSAISLDREDRAFFLAMGVLPLARLVGFSINRADLDAPVAAAASLGMITISLGLAVRQIRRPLREMGIRLPLRLTTLLWLGIAAAGGAGAGVLLHLVGPVPMLSITHNLIVPLSSLLALGIGIAVVEELVFRGALLHAGRVMGDVVAVVYVALIYVVLQINYYSPLMIAISAAGSLLFGWATLKSGSLLPAVVGHILTNTLIVLLGFPLLAP